MTSSPLQLCLSCSGKSRHVVSMSGKATVAELYALARDTLKLDAAIVLQHGFPPKALESTSVPLEDIVRTMDRINVVVLKDDSGKKKKKNKSPAKKSNSGTSASSTVTTTSTSIDDTTGGRGRPQRAAAKAASDAFVDVIQAQDELMVQPNKQKSRSTRGGHPSNNNNTASKRKRTTAVLPGPGRRLADGDVVTPAKPTKRKSSTAKSLSSTEDISFALMGALSGNTTKVSQILRSAMRNSVSHAYDESKAIAKVAAVQSHQYEIISTSDSIITVYYSKGVQGRGVFEESIECIEADALKAVIAAIYHSEQRDLLRPAALAYQSPRVYWNLVRLYTTVTSTDEALSLLLPDLDWSYLKRRPMKLSEKALENQRQKQQQQDEAPNTAAAQEAVEAVEHAMEQLHHHDMSRRRDRAARAAAARSDGHTVELVASEAKWTLVTPTELDEEELKECLGQSHYEEYGDQLISNAGIHNWRELANADASQLAATLSNSHVILIPKVEQWMTRAQQESLDEIMVEVCDGNVDAMTLLRDEARTGTLKDLSNWKQMPDILWSSAPSLQSTGVTVPLLQEWCKRAQRVLEEYEWTSWYATPVE